jgi:ankyrin repeat protein
VRADINGAILNCWTPLNAAAKFGHTDVCALLIASGADIHASEKYGSTPLHMAAENALANV